MIFTKSTTSIFLRCLFCVMILFAFFETSAQSVFSDHDTKADFKKYKTYAWLAPGDSVFNRRRHDKLYGGTIMYAANQELKSRGMSMDTLNPDAIFLFYTQVDEKTKYSQSAILSVGVGVAGPGYYAYGSAPVAGGKITASIEDDGTLTFDMYDMKTRSLVWSGGVNKTFSPKDDVENIIGDYTKKIFKKLPIKVK